MKSILIALILLLVSANCFSQTKQISFTDQTNLEVTNASSQITVRDKKPAGILRVSVISKEFTASLNGFGKAVPPLDAQALRNLEKKDRSTAAQVKRIDSAYNLTQNGTDYYFAGLNSIAADKFKNCSAETPCQIKCQAFIVRLSSKPKRKIF